MIGSEICITKCCGTDVTCNETSREWNHKWLYFSNVVYVVFALIIIVVGSTNLAESQLMELFPFAGEIITGMMSLSFFLLLSGCLGALGTKARSKSTLVTWLFLLMLICIAQIIVSVLLQVNFGEDTFDQYSETQFLANWVKLVEKAENDEEYLTWIQDQQTLGTCCGWLSASDVSENPSYLNCDSGYTVVCADYFSDNFSSKFGDFQVIAVALSSVTLCMVVGTFALICRLKEFYKSENVDFGDYVHVPFGKIKRVEDLVG
ncbi:hypothetical protein TL16_g00329 [Triparma laevis f. inornata]|uniref:Tetraspanin n=1 Tax=Triparma laevis f. inornata TaxID=1714386 RepID=A0A9W6ZDL1_9STRA|nr:hypothetical protein TL16_g00329 [Triparma laevis f. inornata]